MMLLKLAHKATHPGAFLREDLLPAAKMSQAELARHLGVSRQTVCDLIHERRRLSAEMADRLAQFFETSPDFWKRLQAKHDLIVARTQRVAGAAERAINEAAERALTSAQDRVNKLVNGNDEGFANGSEDNEDGRILA